MKKYSRIITGLVAAFALTAAMMPVMNAEAAQTADAAKAVKTYTVTLRAGNVGNFDTAELTDLESDLIDVTDNYVKFTVARGESLSGSFADVFGSETLGAWLSNRVTPTESSYVVNGLSQASMGKTETTEDILTESVTRNVEYVVDYVKIVDPVAYTILYVDSVSGEQLRVPAIRYGSASSEPFAVAPISIANYTAVDAAQTIDLSTGTAVTVSFRYTYSGPVDTVSSTVTTYVPGTTTTNTVVNEIPGETPEAAPPAAAVAGGGTNTVTIPEEDTPLADGDAEADENALAVDIEEEETPLADGTDSSKETIIEEEDTPLASGDTANMGFWSILATVFGVIIAGAVVTLVIYKRKHDSTVAKNGSEKKEK